MIPAPGATAATALAPRRVEAGAPSTDPRRPLEQALDVLPVRLEGVDEGPARPRGRGVGDHRRIGDEWFAHVMLLSWWGHRGDPLVPVSAPIRGRLRCAIAWRASSRRA